MIGSILSSVGGGIGKYLGGGILSTIGKYTGRLAGNYLEKKWFKDKTSTSKFTNLRESFYISMAKYGTPIPLIFGRAKLPGQIIWADEIIQKKNTETVKHYIQKTNTEHTKNIINLEYYLSFAMSICVGTIEDIERVWFGDDIVDLSKYKFRLYKGDKDQLPDPLIQSKSGDLTPAYRGVAYIIFEELPLAEFNDIIPNFTFEVLRKPNIDSKACVEDMIESIVMIPGSGEFVYDTKIQTKYRRIEDDKLINAQKINSHNHYNIANSINSLNQLKSTCPYIKWVSPVVCWFGTDIDARNCSILPAIEFKDNDSEYSEEWQVAGYNRQSAHEISKNKFNSPIYGGTINDASIIRYLTELRERQYNIMFYPMFQMDVEGKPWRGRLTCEAKYVKSFFNKKNGYNEFILHYAKLVKNHVDAFVIGSELIGLTSINENNHFPTVEELIKLAEQVKNIVGPSVKVTYAADWSEYHHTKGGWYNLDPLWASNNIDFIGIDAYFPITNSTSSHISKEEIEKGFASGEGYDYYIDYTDNSKHNLDPAYAWKNLKYWWENKHINPNGQYTNWLPRSKPIWFTEYGFPSIDKATNQPNVFYDTQCIDGGVPRHSNGDTNFLIQRMAIKAFIEFWQTQEYIGEMFLWCWDARPYPAWPKGNIWEDQCLWEKGHWVNYKLGASNLSSILLEISNRCGIDTNNVDLSTINQKIDGLVFNNKITGLNAINTLRAAYFFDINAHYKNIISFKKRGSDKTTNLINHLVMPLTDNSYSEICVTDEVSKINSLNIYYINNNDCYNQHHTRFNNELKSSTNEVSLNFPIVLDPYEVEIIGSSILQNSYKENEIVKLKIYNYKIKITPSDFIQIDDLHKTYTIRVIDINLSNNESIVTGIIDTQSNYFTANKNISELLDHQESYIQNNLAILDLPFNLNKNSGAYLTAYFNSNRSAGLYAKILDFIDNKLNYISNLESGYSICEVINFKQTKGSSIFVIDTKSKIIITTELLNIKQIKGWQNAMFGEEIIQFKYIHKIEKNIFEISHIIRGLYGTENEINKNKNGERFILLDQNPNILQISDNMLGRIMQFEALGIQKTVQFQNNAKQNLKPYIMCYEKSEDALYIKWLDRTKSKDSWNQKHINIDYAYQITIHDNSIRYEYSSNANEININLSQNPLSDDLEISIIRT